MKRVYKKDYSDWSEYYYQYQYTLAKEYYIPYLINNGVSLSNISILDVGCGNGGFVSAFPNTSKKTGLEIKELEKEIFENKQISENALQELILFFSLKMCPFNN